MSDAVWRLVIVGGVAVLAVAAGLVARYLASRAARRAASGPLDLTGLGGGVILFSAADCASCEVARRRLRASGASFREIRYEAEPEAHRAAGVGAVPLIVVVDERADELGRIAGRPSRRALGRLLGVAAVE